MSSPNSAQDPWPVRTVARKISEWIGRLGEVWVEGQVTQLSNRPGIGTCFLVLRDPSADISVPITCRRSVLPDPLSEGARVVVRARPDYYVARGSLSLRATEIRPVGIGELLARLERLKGILAAEGLFEPGRKQTLPFLPRCVGLVTGPGSAAQRDVLHNARRRWPGVRFRLESCPVQGPGAAAAVIEAVGRLAADPEIQVIVIARGGGSVEDLLPFSDEALCRAVAACRTPVVSAIGHEQDFPLLDFVADLRASTPTDAGKRVVPDVAEEQGRIGALQERVRRGAHARLAMEQQWLSAVRSRPVLTDPAALLGGRREEISALRARGRRGAEHRLATAVSDFGHSRARVSALSPGATLARGYAVIQREDGRVVLDPDQVEPGDRLRVRVARGCLDARAE